MRHTVLLVEDDTQTRARLAEVVAAHPSLLLVDAVGSVAEGRDALREHQPAVLLTDLGLPDGEGSELIREAVATNDKTLVMAITVFGDESHVVSAIEAGALGYILKDGTSEKIARSILDLIAGGSPISPPIARSLLRRFRDDEADAAPAANTQSVGRLASGTGEAVAGAEDTRLSNREREVLSLAVRGFGYPEIADLLALSVHTVTTHVRRSYRKLALRSKSEVVYEAPQLDA